MDWLIPSFIAPGVDNLGVTIIANTWAYSRSDNRSVELGNGWTNKLFWLGIRGFLVGFGVLFWFWFCFFFNFPTSLSIYKTSDYHHIKGEKNTVHKSSGSLFSLSLNT